MVRNGKVKRRRALYFRLIRPASGLHAHDMGAHGVPLQQLAGVKALPVFSASEGLGHCHSFHIIPTLKYNGTGLIIEADCGECA